VPTYRDEAVVLRTHKLGEADRIITMLSRQHGKVRAVARGVRRTSSKFGARLEPFSHVDLQFATGRSLDVITQAVTLHPYSEPLAHDYERYTTGQVMIETADRLVTEEREPALQQYQLLVGALHALTSGTSDGPRPPAMVMDAYLLRSVALAGYAPTLTDCARCGAPGPHEAFSPQLGGMVCRRCRPPGSAHPAPATVEYLGSLLTGDWLSTRGVADATVRQGSGLVAAFIGWHLERGLRSLTHVERTRVGQG
jgi:DNA repair protein RecO (recombination protein O)